ncbi:DNA methyltransferase [Roseomonas gilardii]|uniref:DNA methyltransferase n=1 Tax=Roseomonas gilardii TaxID=257708 RepID=UPI00142FB82B|nr:DNA methyltransferase [Roseomonas gilardii]
METTPQMYVAPSMAPSQPELEDLRLEQSRLNITSRSRTSRLPWKGQFSPELIEYLLETVCPTASRVFDPFCGSGTVLYEVAQRGGSGFGTEVNPAAWHLAALVSFCAQNPAAKLSTRNNLRTLREGLSRTSDLFSHGTSPADVLAVVHSSEHDIMLRLCVAAAVLLGMGDKPTWTTDAALRGLIAIETLLSEIDSYSGIGICHLADARSTPLENQSIDAVITSPPYINVFNYHQNYRPATELLGWHPLEAAQSEIGANRKFRMNRFRTAVQYCLDISQTLDEMSRVCITGAPVLMVVGRESNVLGAAFRNSDLIVELMEHAGAFKLRRSAERVFTNRFGARIYEDVIVAECAGHDRIDPAFARSVGVRALGAALATVPEKNRTTLEAAMDAAGEIEPSRLLTIHPPAALMVSK